MTTDLEKDVVYARARGYWTSAPVGEKGTVPRLILKSFRKRPLELTMDIYRPYGEALSPRPLLLMMHGGSFYIGHKEEAGQVAWCHHFATLGYVAVSINYRMGFLPAKCSLRKAEQRALEDARAALTYLLSREDLRVDPDRVFAAGTSAGAITALNLAFLGTGDSRVRIRAAGAFWGSVHSLEVLDKADVPILSFQSVNDPIMPNGKGYPFGPSLGPFKFVMALFSDVMYGTGAIHQKAMEKGMVSEHHPCPETGHRLHLDEEGRFTSRFYDIQDAMAGFFGKC